MIRQPWVGECRRYRPGLIEFVAHGTRERATAAELAHLERCRDCEAELTELALVIAAMRRLGRLAGAAQSRPDAWNRLRGRLERSRSAAQRGTWLSRLRLGSAMVSAVVVAVVVGPAITGGSSARDLVASPLIERSPALVQELRAEAAFIAAVGVGNRSKRVVDRTSSIVVNYPDGLRPRGKEVESKRLNRWPLKAT